MDVKLAVHSGGRVDRTIPLGDEDFLIGRDLACHFRVDHERVGHRHCRIRHSGGGRVVVEDLNTIHGTLVNDHPIRRHEVRDGDRLRVGPTTFVFQIGAPAADRKGRTGSNNSSSLGNASWIAEEADPLVPKVVSRNPLDSNFESAATLSARQLLARMTGKLDAGDLRKGFRVLEHEGIGVVRLLEESIVEDAAVRRIAQELHTLVESGRGRIVVNLESVDNLSIQAVGMLVEVRDLCRAAGGLLKLCKPSPPVARALALMNLAGQFEVAADEREAVEGAWPGAAAILPHPAEAAAAPAGRVRLFALLGKARGKAVEVKPAKFLIGRDQSCHLRPNSPAISRMHTVIEQRDGRSFVRDLGAKNGTVLNGRVLRGEEAEFSHGDRLQIGPLLFAVALGDRELALDAEEAAGPGDSWLIGADRGPAPDPGLGPDAEPAADSTMLVESPNFRHAPAPPEPRRPVLAAAVPIKDLAYEVAGGALLVTVLLADLNDEPEVGPIRYELLALFEQAELPRRVVVSLDRVRYMSSRAVGVLLAHFQRLSRVGGAMRLCGVHGNNLKVLEQMRVPMLIDVFPTAEEALREPWE